MERIRVLVVDDSLLIRRALRECFRSDPEIQVVGVAETGIRALEQIEALRPDVVTLDIEMPEMDGLETLRSLRDRGSRIPVIMFSKYTSEGATASLEALELGASDVVAKPEAHGGKGSTCDIVKRQLSTRIRALGRKARKAREQVVDSSPRVNVPTPVALFETAQSIRAVAIAISTGGPSALIDIVSKLDAGLSVPIFITQHMPPMFTKFLAERLTARGNLEAIEASEGMIVKPGKIYIAPGDFHLESRRVDDEVIIHISDGPRENSCRPSADVMFRSLSHVYGAELLGIVMTGMGQDGRRGCEEIKSRGGIVAAQDEASSLVWGMPRSVIMAGIHDFIVPLSEVATLINTCGERSSEER